MQVPSVLLLDDGELEVAREALDSLDAEVVWRRSLTVKRRIACRHQLLITTAFRALASEHVFRDVPRDERPVWITFHSQDFLPFRERLRHIGVDYLVQTMIEPELFRLLLLRVLFRDDERRGARRLPVGTSVSCRLGNQHLATTLAEISPGGCLLLSREPVERNTQLVLELPITLRDAASESQIPGRVVRSERVERDSQGALWTLAIEFDRAPGSPVPSLERLGTGQAIGARVISFEAAPVVTVLPVLPVEQESPAPRLANEGEQTGDSVRSEDVSQPCAAFGLEDELEQEEVAKDRRIDPRAVLARRQIPMLNEENGIVFGRDLSRRGVRIEPCALAVGDTLTLAIPGVPPEEPLLLRAVVARDEGPDGLIVRFSDPEQGDLSRLDKIVASLPPIEALADDPLGQECVVVVDRPTPERS